MKKKFYMYRHCFNSQRCLVVGGGGVGGGDGICDLDGTVASIY